MRRVSVFLVSLLRLFSVSVLSALLVIARYLLRTPQPITNGLAGQDRLFVWTHGHISYKVLGADANRPLVMLHAPEIGGSSYEFRALVEALAQHYHVYALDLLGFGLSDHPALHYTSETYTTLCEDFLTKVVQRPALVLASGLSCNYSIALASTHPELCERLVLLAPYALLRNTNGSLHVSKTMQQPFLALLLYALLTIRVVLRRVLARQQQVSEAAITQDELDHAFGVAHQFGAEHAAIAFLAGQLWFDVAPQARTLTIPMLLLWGANTVQADSSIAELYAGNDQARSVFIQNAGLRPHREQPDEVVAQILQWDSPDTTVQRNEQVPAQRNDIIVPDDEPHVSQEELGVGAETVVEPSFQEVEAYCVKCKQKRIMVDPVDTVTKNGRHAKSGTCPICGTKLFRFVSTQEE